MEAEVTHEERIRPTVVKSIACILKCTEEDADLLAEGIVLLAEARSIDNEKNQLAKVKHRSQMRGGDAFGL